MTKEGIEKQLYMLISQTKLTKTSNFCCLFFTGFLLVFLIIGDAPRSLMSSEWQHRWALLFSTIAALLALARVCWKWYSKSKIFGIFEVIATYANTILIICMTGNAFDLSKSVTLLLTLIAIIYSVTLFLVAAWYESKGIKQKKLLTYIFYSVFTLVIIVGFLVGITKSVLLAEIEMVLIGCLVGLHIILYFFVLDFPYKRKLVKKFGKEQLTVPTSKNILPSSIFINKRNHHNNK